MSVAGVWLPVSLAALAVLAAFPAALCLTPAPRRPAAPRSAVVRVVAPLVFVVLLLGLLGAVAT